MSAPAAERLREFAAAQAAASPLYECLSAGAAGDAEVSALVGDASPELFLAAAQRVLFREPWHPLTRYYSSLGGADGPDGELWPLFRAFVLERAEAIRPLLAERSVREELVRPAALLYPGLAVVAKEAGKAPIGLLEAGAGAGFRLVPDRYGFRYAVAGGGPDISRGKKTARLVLDCQVTEAAAKPADGFGKQAKLPAIAARIGLDADPVDVADEDELTWLEACVWPDQPRRLRLLRLAADEVVAAKPPLRRADPVTGLADAAARIPAEHPLVVTSCGLLDGRPAEFAAAWLDALRTLASHRPLWWVSQEGYQAFPGEPRDGAAHLAEADRVLSVINWTGGEVRVRRLATADRLTRGLTWLGPN
ncbi:DUF2332 domain-containing protein [Crossiella sp. CA-258035]|uniref:DUF2332 domain-containing protein n=1 Tax=Crossiella sp. CA-258035 TaxID=2981138 RepID=UPI0024BC86EC|nr:DUF2332 domain-containing protein [Crossiella sp. CA-258035]WHT18542.1 DUF2332 domain-containing protein [Crossiella sp. CA-258035]